jgi:hypothetical protein
MAVLAIDFFTALTQMMFQVPQFQRLLDLTGHPLCFPRHVLTFAFQCSVQGSAMTEAMLSASPPLPKTYAR